MQERKIYSLTGGKLRRAYCQEGITIGNDARAYLADGQAHFMILRRFCSYTPESKWGRFHMQLHLNKDCICVFRAFAMDIADEEQEELTAMEHFFMDGTVSVADKKRAFDNAGGIQVTNREDVLLYDLQGEYLFVAIEITGSGEGYIDNMFLDSQGDNFMQTFPEIYQEEGSFFHRYMSVFSTIYNGIDNEISHIDQYLDPDTAPAELLPQYADWLGLELEGEFLEEDLLRRLIREAYQLNRIKGTKQCIRRLISLVLGQDAIIVERKRLDGYISQEDKRIYQKLYGCDEQDIVILVNRERNERVQAQLLYLINQFKPVKSHVELIFYKDFSRLDTYSFMDKDRLLSGTGQGVLNNRQTLNGTSRLG